jgi:alpha-tubulin suppressor-like RCC1 family protein
MVLGLALAGALSGCLGPGDFRCQEHSQCGGGDGASCEVNGRCSQRDTGCPSRRRYRHHDGPDSDRCVASSCGDNPIRAISAGLQHACVVRKDGGIWCWGRNDDGQLGDGTHTPRSLAVPVKAIEGATAVAAGEHHTCAVAGGSVLCWGADVAGQLGDGGGAPHDTPIPVAGISDAVGVAAGAAFTCAVLQDGTARCWGDNTLGQLGDGGPAQPARAPTPVFALGGVRVLSTRSRHVCALRGDETLWCWGAGGNGQLGDGASMNRAQPVRVGTLTAVTDVTTGFQHTCAATRAAGLFCWGSNDAGQLGLPSGANQPQPVAVPIVDNPIAVAAGALHTCAIRQGGATLCWGNNSAGQLGEGTTSSLPTPVPVTDLVTGVQVVAGDEFSCARTSDDALFCWGDNHYGQLGIGSATIRPRAAPVPSVTDAAGLAAGGAHTCVVTDKMTATGHERRAACWGENQAGQLGYNDTVDRSTAKDTKVEIDAVEIAAGLEHTCARAEDGKLWCWGRGQGGRLGPDHMVDAKLPSAITLPPGVAVVGVAAGDAHTCVVRQDGTALCWGTNGDGQLGDGTTMDRPGPAPVLGSDGLTPLGMIDGLAAGAYHTCARSWGVIRCWGRGTRGQLGDGARLSRPLPANVAPHSGDIAIRATAVAAGADHACALDDSGEVWCWGRGTEGQLGTGETADAPTPLNVLTLSSARNVATGGAHSCAITADRTVTCWGANDDGQLGDGTTETSAAPRPVPGLTDAEQLSAGASHTCARRTDGTVWCWGGNFAGQLGDGVLLARSDPLLARLSCH